MQDFFVIEPEAAGGLGPQTVMDRTVHPPRILTLHYEFQDWLGDQLVESFPCYLMTRELASRIEHSGLSGAAFHSATVTLGEQFLQINSEGRLPEFLWMKVHGVCGVDDFGIGKDYRLVVSSRALDVLKSTHPKGMDVESYHSSP